MLVPHILGKVGNFCIRLLVASFRICLPIFIEIRLYLTDIEQNLSRHVFVLKHDIDIIKKVKTNLTMHADFCGKNRSQSS